MSNLDERNESQNEQQNMPLNELGRGVTRLARSGPKRETAVISVRLETNDIARLEGIGHETGKTVSQVIRDAIVAYRVIRPAMTVGLWSGSTVIIGEPDGVSRNLDWDVSCSEMAPNSTGTAVPIQP